MDLKAAKRSRQTWCQGLKYTNKLQVPWLASSGASTPCIEGAAFKSKPLYPLLIPTEGVTEACSTVPYRRSHKVLQGLETSLEPQGKSYGQSSAQAESLCSAQGPKHPN